MVDIPTRISTTCSTLLDHLYTNDVEKNVACHVLDYDVSDHLPLFFSINSSPVRNQTTPVKIRDMKQFYEEAFLNDLTIAIQHLKLDLTIAVHHHKLPVRILFRYFTTS